MDYSTQNEKTKEYITMSKMTNREKLEILTIFQNGVLYA